jgi:hypothetical protein
MEELKSDAELLGNIEDVRQKFILLGFKGSLAEFLAELVKSKQSKLDKVVFDGNHFEGSGTVSDPLKVKFTDLTELEKRLSKIEAYINTLDTF